MSTRAMIEKLGSFTVIPAKSLPRIKFGAGIYLLRETRFGGLGGKPPRYSRLTILAHARARGH